MAEKKTFRDSTQIVESTRGVPEKTRDDANKKLPQYGPGEPTYGGNDPNYGNKSGPDLTTPAKPLTPAQRTTPPHTTGEKR